MYSNAFVKRLEIQNENKDAEIARLRREVEQLRDDLETEQERGRLLWEALKPFERKWTGYIHWKTRMFLRGIENLHIVDYLIEDAHSDDRDAAEKRVYYIRLNDDFMNAMQVSASYRRHISDRIQPDAADINQQFVQQMKKERQ